MGIFSDILRIQRRNRRKKEIMQDEAKRAETTYFGRKSIRLQIVGLVVAIIGMIALLIVHSSVTNSSNPDLVGVLLTIFYITFALIELVGMLIILFGGWSNARFQWKCNKKPIGKTALTMNLITTLVCVSLIIITLVSLAG